MSGDEPTAENTAPFCHRCWKYLKPRSVALHWLCEVRDRNFLWQQSEIVDEWMPAEVNQFWKTQMDTSEKIETMLKDSARREEFERITYMMREGRHSWLYQGYQKIPSSSRYISDQVKEEVLERDGDQCVKCGSTRDLQYEHVIPHTRGGSSAKANIQLLCGDCNRSKSNKFVS